MSPEAGFLNLDIAAAGAALHRAGNLACANVARARLQLNLARQVRELHVARSRLYVDVATRAFNDLIARAAAGADRGIRGHSDLVVHRNVAHVHIVNVNVVALLADRRILLDLRGRRRRRPARQPVVAHVNFAANEDRSADEPARTVTSPERVSTSRSTGPLTCKVLSNVALRAGSKNSGRGETARPARSRQRSLNRRSAGHGEKLSGECECLFIA